MPTENDIIKLILILYAKYLLFDFQIIQTMELYFILQKYILISDGCDRSRSYWVEDRYRISTPWCQGHINREADFILQVITSCRQVIVQFFNYYRFLDF